MFNSNSLQTGVFADIANAVRKQGCVLFLGAGVHAPPPPTLSSQYPESHRPLIGSQLSLYLAKESQYEIRRRGDDPKNLRRVSLDFELARGRPKLLEAVRHSVQEGKKGSPILSALASLPFPLIVTTNYDTLFEEAVRSCGKEPIVSHYHSNLETKELTFDYPDGWPSPDRPFVVKIHGDIIRDASSIVITEEDYIHFVRRMSEKDQFNPLPLTALSYIVKFPTLFIGYSLLDYNLRILFKSLHWRSTLGSPPQKYSIDYRPDPLVMEVLQNHRREVIYVVEDVWQFVPELVKAVLGREMHL